MSRRTAALLKEQEGVRGESYRMGLVAVALEVGHAIEAGEGSAITLVAVAVELLLGENVSTVLFAAVRS
jgi:hypothetical protein